ncbi:MAG: hypothetical protein NUV75_11390 [Gallionella sp.]|nr:hypothetical protein [Gallionella sp.]
MSGLSVNMDQAQVANVELAVPYAKIRNLEDAVKRLPQLSVEIKHHFCQGVYAREGLIPKGAVFVGRVHLQSQINIIAKGDISVLTENGLVRMTAPCVMESPLGAQRAAYAHEDTVWITILGTNETDPEVIFNTLTLSTFEEFEIACAEIVRLTEKQ